MNTARLNGQPAYSKTPAASSAWREEMLGQILTRMREQPLEAPRAAAPKVPAWPGKGQYVDLYV